MMSPNLETAPSIFSLAQKKGKYSCVEIWICTISEDLTNHKSDTYKERENKCKTQYGHSLVSVIHEVPHHQLHHEWAVAGCTFSPADFFSS